MSVRKTLVLLLAVFALSFLVACGGGGNGTVTNPIAPPTGSFSATSLNGTYVFSVSGVDQNNGAPYAILGTLIANGSGKITGGTLDINDSAEFTSPAAGATINNNGFYSVTADGRGQATIGTNISNFQNLTFDFVLSSSSHGLITEFDSFGSGSGTLDLQASNTTPTGAYAFSLSGASSSGTPWAAVGNFAISGASVTGLEDLAEGPLLAYTNQPLTGSLALTSSNGPATTLTTTAFNGLFDVFAIDSTQLKFIEMDNTATLSGDAFAQTSTALPTGNLSFTLLGATSAGAPFAAGGIMSNSSGAGGAVTGTEDYNSDGSLSSATTPGPFSATLTADGVGRYTLGGFATFVGGSSYAAYPSSGGLLLLEIDSGGITVGAAYAQTAGATFAASQGYGLNLSGTNLGAATGSIQEVDDIAEFTANSNATISGVLDENFSPGGSPQSGLPLVTSGSNFGAIDTSGRYGLSVAVGNNNVSSLEGGLTLTFYAVDGTTFPFIESDSGQVATGVIVLQNPSAATPALSKSHNLFVPRPLIHPHTKEQKNK